MTRLYLLRHGIAVPSGTPDMFEDDRPLTATGEKRIRQVARGLRRLDLSLDRIVTSPLPRARKTAEIVAGVLGIEDRLEVSEALRADHDAASIRDWIVGRDESKLMLVGHNPSLSDLVGLLVAGASGSLPFEIRKGGIAALVGDEGKTWRLDWMARPQIFRRLD